MARIRTKTVLWTVVLVLIGLGATTSLQAVCPEPTLVPNPTFEGTGGGVLEGASGTAPDGWRAFAVAGGTATVEIVPVAVDELYPGSPATRAVRFAVTTFAGDQGFDHDPSRFAMDPHLNHHAEFYIRSGNADNSAQQYRFGFPVFDGTGAFLLRETGSPIDQGSPVSTATSSWQRVRARSFMDIDALFGHISFRVQDDGGTENAILIALPSVVASPEPQANPGFDRTLGGFREGGGNVTGNIPDDWRAFAVGGAAITTDIVDVAADELYPGSPATRATLLQIDTYGVDQGFDLDISRFQMFPGVTYQGSAYVRSANPDNSNQTFHMQFPIFGGPAYNRDPLVSPFLGREPGTLANATATSAWQRFTGPLFQDSQAESGVLAFRVPNDGGAGNAILIAMPAVKPAASDNLVPNPVFAGTGGAAVGDVTGAVPDQWRAIAPTGSGAPPSLVNPDFEVDPEGTNVGGSNLIDATTLTGWRFFAVADASGSAAVTSTATSSGTQGIELARDNALGDSALDKDTPTLREPIPPQQRVYKLLVDARDGGPYGGTPLLNIGVQFATAGRGAGFDPAAVFETIGTTATSDTTGWMSTRFDLGPGAGRSVHLDNVRVTDVTSGVDRMINPGFEASDTRPLAWRFFAVGGTVGSATLSNDAHSGANAVLLEVTEDTGDTDRDIGLDINDHKVAVRAGEEVEVRLFARKVSGADTRLALNVAAFQANGTLVSVVTNPLLNPSAANYEEFVANVPIPAGAALLNVGFRITDAVGTRTIGSYLIDDVTVTGLTPIDPFVPSAAEIATVPLAADALFPGSPATNAVEWRQTLFGSNDALFDHLNFPFPIMTGRDYRTSLYVKTANSDAANQQFDLIIQLREGGSPIDEAAGSFTATATWQELEVGSLQTLEGDAGLIRFRLADDGGADDAILIALPVVEQEEPVDGLVPNHEFAGTGGALEGAATGTVPDRWRTFAVAGSAADSLITPLAAGELFPGSPAVSAVTFRRTAFEGDAGFDTHYARHPLVPGTPYRVSVYARTANSDLSSQAFSFGHPVFAQGTTFLGRGPGSFDGTADTNWQLFQGPVFTDPVADTGHIALRINTQDGADDAVSIALPMVQKACPTVETITPAMGGSGDLITDATVTGTNFIADAVTVRLVKAGEPDIVGTNLVVFDETSMLVSFDLTGAAGGDWDVVVCPGGDCEPGLLAAGFNIIGCNVPFADADGDGDVDSRDFAEFQRCFTGTGDPTGSFDPVECRCFDRDGAQDVDFADFVTFHLCASGPEIPADPACDD